MDLLTVVADGQCVAVKPVADQSCTECDSVNALCQPSSTNAILCTGNGICGKFGCLCDAGYSGTFCQVPPECPTAQDTHLTCCPLPYVSAVTGALSLGMGRSKIHITNTDLRFV